MRHTVAILAILLLASCGGDTAKQAPIAQPIQLATTISRSAMAVRSPKDYHPILQQLYVAYFGRPADTGGLQFYAQQLANTNAPTSLDRFVAAYQSDAIVRAMVDAFMSSAESQRLYPGDTGAFIDAVYRNIFNRVSDAAGRAYWINAIDQAIMPRGAAAFTIMSSAVLSKNSDGDLVNKKVLAASLFTDNLVTQQLVNSYSGDAVNGIVRDEISKVSAAMSISTVDNLMYALVSRLLGRSTGRTVFHGVVAMGNPLKDSLVTIENAARERIAQGITDLKGRFRLMLYPDKKPTPPLKSTALSRIDGKDITQTSVSTDDPSSDMVLNMNPVTTFIAHNYFNSTPEDLSRPLPNIPELLTSISAAAKETLGKLWPPGTFDAIKEAFVADPSLGEMDSTLERISIEVNGQTSTIRNFDQKIIATTTTAQLKTGRAGSSDTEVVTALEASEAITSRGALPDQVQHYNNENASGVLPAPANLRAEKTGTLSFKLSWDPVPGARQYHVYESRDTAPGVSAGVYANALLVPAYATGGNAAGENTIEYTVAESGTYHWVVGAVKDAASPAEYALGTTSDPASLNFDASRPITCKSETQTVYVRRYCYYETVSGGITSRFQHGTETLTRISDGKIWQQINWADNKWHGVSTEYSSLTGRPTTVTTYVNGVKIGYAMREFESTFIESNFVAAQNTFGYYSPIERSFCSKNASDVAVSRRGALFMIRRNQPSSPIGTKSYELTCGANNLTKGVSCCRIP